MAPRSETRGPARAHHLGVRQVREATVLPPRQSSVRCSGTVLPPYALCAACSLRSQEEIRGGSERRGARALAGDPVEVQQGQREERREPREPAANAATGQDAAEKVQ